MVLSLAPIQAKYLISLPLHRSQNIIKETETEVQVELFLIPNFELKQEILIMGQNVTVLQPESLAKEIKKSLQESLKNYN